MEHTISSTSAQESVLDDIALQLEPAAKNIRFANYIIDVIAYYIFSYIVGMLIALVGLTYLLVDKLSLYAISFVVYFIYYFLFELTTGRTLGKLITGTHVVSITGDNPTKKQVLLRNLSRLVPFEPFSFLGDGTGWHDTWSDTMVVKNK